MGLRAWYRRQVVAVAVAVHARGDTVYVMRVPNMNALQLATRINAIEAVGWRLEQQEQSRRSRSNKELVWTLTFRRAE